MIGWFLHLFCGSGKNPVKFPPNFPARSKKAARHYRVPKSEGYLNRSSPGVKRGGIKGEAKRWREREQGLKGKEGGEMRENGWEERGPKAHSKTSDFGTPRERKMRRNTFCTNFLKTPRGPGHPRLKFSGHPRFLSSKPIFPKRRLVLSRDNAPNFSATTPIAWKTSTPPGGLRSSKKL